MDFDLDKVQNFCTYCDYRHSICCDESEVFRAFETKQCPNFVLGKCFKCSVQISNGHQFVEGVCSDVFDFSGCCNFKS